MNITGYLKRKMAMLSLALARVEKSSLNQVSDALGGEGSLNETMEQGSMGDNMLKGVLTMEIKEMRWRMYKILNATQNLSTKIVGYDEDGLPITETTEHARQLIRNVNVDKTDSYKVELIINNDDDVKSTSEALSNEKLNLHEDGIEIDNREDRHDLVVKDKDIIVSSDKSLGEISFNDMVSSMKSDKAIIIHREFRPKFEIEQYTKKLVVKNVGDGTKLIEFYISKYPDEFDRKTRLLISEIKKVMKNPRSSDIVDVDKIGFVTNKAIGAANGLEFIYEVEKFYKVTEHDGHYVIKFMVRPLVDGEFIFNKHKLDDLEKKYASKAPKNLKK